MGARGPRQRNRRPERAAAPAGASALPPGFVALAREWLGAEADAFLAACAQPPGLAVRANRLKGGLPALLPALDAVADTWPRVPWWPEALLPPPDVASRLAAGLPARIGALYAQDPAALAAVAALDPQPGERVLDLCAAPGGKSTAIADRLGGQGLLVGNDLEAPRARELQRTLERWGAANAAVLVLPPADLAARAPGYFDRVLVDAPCSGEAMFARRPRAAADWSARHVAGCAARQGHLLDSARLLVRPGGVLVYATCTFNPYENEGIIAAYLATHPADWLEDVGAYLPGAAPGRPDLLPAAAGPRDGEVARCARLWPHHGPGAGHFVARLRVANETEDSARPHVGAVARGAARRTPTVAAPTVAVGATDRADAAEVQRLLAAVALDLEAAGDVVVRGSHAYLVRADLPSDLAALALAPGLHVAERRGRTWRPAHALAMALRPGQAQDCTCLDDDAAVTFLAGRPVADRGSGITLAAWRGFPLGWGRGRDGLLTPLRQPLHGVVG